MKRMYCVCDTALFTYRFNRLVSHTRYSSSRYCVHNTAENNYMHISPLAVLWFVFYFMRFFSLFQLNFFRVISLITLTVLIVCRFFPHTYPIASTTNRMSVSIHEIVAFFLCCSLLFVQSFVRSSFASFFLFAHRTAAADLIKFTITARCSTFVSVCVCVCVCIRMELTRHVCTHNCVKHTHTQHSFSFMCVCTFQHHWSFL